MKLTKLFSAKKLFTAVFSVFMLSMLVSCESTKAQTETPAPVTAEAEIVQEAPKATLTKENARMFWTINGTDKNGNPSKIYIQGTFHIADERCYPLADEVIDAFKSADRLYGELSTDSTAELIARLTEVYAESLQNANGRHISDSLSEEDIKFLKDLISEPYFNAYNLYEPWVFSSLLSTVLFTLNGFSSEYGLEAYFNNLAAETGKTVDGLDTVDCQIEALSIGTYEQQLSSFKSVIEGLRNLEGSKKEALDFYQNYIDGNIESIGAKICLSEQSDDTPVELQEYNKLTNKFFYTDRNIKWAAKFAELLNEGGTTFVFAGVGHFCGNDSVFTHMAANQTLSF